MGLGGLVASGGLRLYWDLPSVHRGMSHFPATLLWKAVLEHLPCARHCAKHWGVRDDQRPFLSFKLARETHLPAINSKTRQKIRARVTYLLQLQGVPREGTDSAWLGWKEGCDGPRVVLVGLITPALEAHPRGSTA